MQRVINGWSYSAEDTGRFGANDELRATVALLGLAELPLEGALCAHAIEESARAGLIGTQRYILDLPTRGSPAGGFSPITMFQVELKGLLFLSAPPYSAIPSAIARAAWFAMLMAVCGFTCNIGLRATPRFPIGLQRSAARSDRPFASIYRAQTLARCIGGCHPWRSSTDSAVSPQPLENQHANGLAAVERL